MRVGELGVGDVAFITPYALGYASDKQLLVSKFALASDKHTATASIKIRIYSDTLVEIFAETLLTRWTGACIPVSGAMLGVVIDSSM